MGRLKRRFSNGIAAPTSEVIRLEDKEFIEVMNNVFSFDGAEVLSSEISLPERRLDFRFNYVAAMRPTGMVWRILRMHLGQIDDIIFSYDSKELGFAHEVMRHVNLGFMARNNPSSFPKLEGALWNDHRGAELFEISFEKYPYFHDRILKKKNPAAKGKVMFEWAPQSDWSRKLVDNVECRAIELEFLTPAADKPWSE